uniref:Ig-like domain-containing protein n=1 Tax=Emticicia sp. TaxID=1930953 RepID=UPI0037525A64
TICSGGTTSLTATVSNGTGTTSYQWQSSTDNVTLTNISGATSSTYASGVLTATTYYRLVATQTGSGCGTATSGVSTITVNALPSAPTATGATRCGTGTVTLSASGCAGTYNWYASSTGGASLSANATYTTPSISTTTTYYVDCTVNACVSTTRDPAIATVNAIPAAPTTTPGNRCGPGTVVLSNNCAGISNWFSALTGGTSLGTGTTFTTPSITSNTTYYADCSLNGCLSTSRSSALATVLTPPTATASNSGVHCLGTTFKLIGGGNGVSFSWSGPDSFTSTSQSPLVPSASAAMAGVYTITVIASNGCTTTETTNLVINTNCNSICTSVVQLVPTNPTGCSATDGSIFVTEHSGGPFYENSIDGITWYNSEKTYSNLGVGYYTIFIRDKTSQIICRTVSVTLTAITTAYYTGETVTNATSCTGTNGSIVLQGVVGTDKVSWISSTNRTYVAVSTLSPTNTISNLAAGQYYVIVTRGGNPLFCYSERMVTIPNSGTPCTAGLCTASGSSNLFPNGDFGSGSSKIGTPLLSSETQYSFAPMNCVSPNDGNYTITNTTDCNGATAGGNIFGTWDILTQDHTIGDTDGYMMIVNASFNPDIVIEKTITNLCPNTKYEYSVWIYNLCPPTNTSGCPNKPNLTFLIDGVGKYNTGTLNTSGWQQVGFTFSTGNSTTSTFSIRNNTLGGVGNDWVIDDISITQCLPTINQSASALKCIGTTAQTVSATVTDINQQYQYYKWQESTDNGSTWADLTSATLASFSSNTYTVSYNLPSPITLALNGRKYRIIVGTSTTNLANSSCSFLSTGTTIIVPTIVVTTSTTQTICLGSSASITANATGGTSPYTYTWNNGVGTGSPKSVSPSSTTTYTVTVTDANACSATATTQVIVNVIPSAPTSTGNSRCGTGTILLSASGCAGGTISWYGALTGGSALTTGASYTTPSISVSTTYYLECSTNGCVSARASVAATVYSIPSAPTITDGSNCGTGTIILSASGCPGGTIQWYASQTGTTALASGTSFTLTSLTSSTVYFASCTDANTCVSTTRNYGVATINPIPQAELTSINPTCLGMQSVSNGKLLLNKFEGIDSFSYNIGSTYNSGSATAFAVIPANGEILTGIADPSTSVSYTVRIKNIENCTIDRTVTIAKQCGVCPVSYCEPPSNIVKTK